MVSFPVFVLANPRLPSLPRARAKGAYFAKGPNRLRSGSLDPRLPQNRSPRPCGLPIPNASTCEPSRVRTASYPHPNHVGAKSDELTLMESHSCTKPRGDGSKIESQAKSSLNVPVFRPSAVLTSLESTLPRPHESVSKQRTLTSLESTLTSSRTSHSKQRTLSPFRMNTYAISLSNSFRMNTSKKGGGRGVGE
jgi:hypothetical protein